MSSRRGREKRDRPSLEKRDGIRNKAYRSRVASFSFISLS